MPVAVGRGLPFSVRVAQSQVRVAQSQVPTRSLSLSEDDGRSGSSVTAVECSISVVIPTRNRAGLLPPLVRAVLRQQGVELRELVIVDDDSTDGSWDVLVRCAASDNRVHVQRLARHGGPAVARNAGWQSASSDVIAFTDDDCIPHRGWLAGLVAAHAAGADVVQGMTLPDIEEYGDRGTFSHWIDIEDFTHLYETCNISYRRSLLESLAGFDESFGTSRGGAPNGEDADLGWRAAKSGAQCRFSSEAVVRHPVTPSSFARAMRGRLRSYRMAYFLRQHPEFRQYLYHGCFFQRSHPSALGALVAWAPFCMTRRAGFFALGVVGALPYTYLRIRVLRLPGRRRRWPLIILGAWLIDVSDVAVLACASLRWRRLLL